MLTTLFTIVPSSVVDHRFNLLLLSLHSLVTEHKLGVIPAVHG